MPNIPPLGLWGKPDGPSGGAPSAAVDLVASLPGATTPRNVLEVWCGDAGGVPRLVWARTPVGPSSATAAVTAYNGYVTISWTNPTPMARDRYEIKRTDGSIAGYALASDTSFVDLNPKSLNGPYTVTALLESVRALTPAVTNALTLYDSPGSVSATYYPNYVPSLEQVSLSWTAPSYGRPRGYSLYRSINGGASWSWMTDVGSAALSFIDNGMIRGEVNTYLVNPFLADYGGGRAAAVAVQIDPPTCVPNPATGMACSGGPVVTYPPFGTSTGVYDPGGGCGGTTYADYNGNMARVEWGAPAGDVGGYVLEAYDAPARPAWTVIAYPPANATCWIYLGAAGGGIYPGQDVYFRITALAANPAAGNSAAVDVSGPTHGR